MAEIVAKPPCRKCGGAGWYMYDDNHGKPCEVCCPHDQGWWQLGVNYGAREGHWCCKAHCGETRAERPENS